MNKGQIVDEPFVPRREVVLFSEVKGFKIYSVHMFSICQLQDGKSNTTSIKNDAALIYIYTVTK